MYASKKKKDKIKLKFKKIYFFLFSLEKFKNRPPVKLEELRNIDCLNLKNF
jgi:hypothetical protein